MNLIDTLKSKGFKAVSMESDYFSKKETYQKGSVFVDVYSQTEDRDWFIINAKLRVEANNKFDIIAKLDDVLDLFDN